MRSILIALTFAASALLPAAAGAECLPSPEAVRAIHGQGAWSSYHHVNGRLCYFLGERHTKIAARSPVPRERPLTAPPVIRTGPPDRPRLPETTEVAPPPAPVQLADLSPDQPLREAMENYVRDRYWVLMWRARN